MLRQEILPLLAPKLKDVLNCLPHWAESSLEEIRIRVQKPLFLYCRRGEIILGNKGVVSDPSLAYYPSSEDLHRTLQLISSCSLYAFEEELRRGYITVPGGHRIGLCGRAILEKGFIKFQKDISGLNFRLARQVKGASQNILRFLFNPNGKIRSTLIISPPQAGKTTLLRDLSRVLGSGCSGKSFKVAVVDERSEIAGAYGGVPQLDIGMRTDLLDACPKAEGMMLVVRSMSPQVIITDEIGSPEDVNAVLEVANAGVSLIASAHGASLQELNRRPSLKQILSLGVFERFIVLSRNKGPGTVETVIEANPGNRMV